MAKHRPTQAAGCLEWLPAVCLLTQCSAKPQCQLFSAQGPSCTSYPPGECSLCCPLGHPAGLSAKKCHLARDVSCSPGLVATLQGSQRAATSLSLLLVPCTGVVAPNHTEWWVLPVPPPNEASNGQPQEQANPPAHFEIPARCLQCPLPRFHFSLPLGQRLLPGSDVAILPLGSILAQFASILGALQTQAHRLSTDPES